MRSTAIHDTLSKGSFSWIYLIIFIIKLAYYSAAYAQPQGKQMPDRDTRIWKPFLVDLKINQQDTVVNYDLSFTSGIGRSTEFISTELSTGAGAGVLVASQAYLHDGQNDRFIRLDTNYTLDQPEKLTTLRLGDAISRPATTLGRSVRFAGIQYGSNFQVQPGLITAPLASLSGQAAVPSMVDLYINNVLQSSQAVPPGPFSITTPPMIAGDGEIVMKVRDISGREELISGRFYSTPYLLAPGLSEFSLEAGTLRNNYGLPEDRYRSLFSSASYRRGITEKFTAELGAQGSSDGSKNLLASGMPV